MLESCYFGVRGFLAQSFGVPNALDLLKHNSKSQQVSTRENIAPQVHAHLGQRQALALPGMMPGLPGMPMVPGPRGEEVRTAA